MKIKDYLYMSRGISYSLEYIAICSNMKDGFD